MDKQKMWEKEQANQPWALVPGYTPRRVLTGAVAAAPARPAIQRGQSGTAIAVLSLSGVITQHPDWMGDSNLDGFVSDFLSAVSDQAVTSILICIDSPGGSVYGVQEAAQVIQAARARKPVIAFANSLAASAAYWIGCAASEFYCTPGGEVGSIGVWQAHMDISGAVSAAGIKPTIISAGKYKVEGNPYEPLDQDALSFMQSRVDDYYTAFVGAVAAARGVKPDAVKSGMGQGRVLGAKEAMKQGMIDGVMSFPQLLQSLSQKNRPMTSRKNEGASLSIARLKLELMATPKDQPPRKKEIASVAIARKRLELI